MTLGPGRETQQREAWGLLCTSGPLHDQARQLHMCVHYSQSVTITWKALKILPISDKHIPIPAEN